MQCSICQTLESPKWYKNKTECKSCFNKAYFKQHRSRMTLLRKEWIKNNPHKDKEYKNQFQSEHRDKYLKLHKHEEAKRRAKKLKATPQWLTKEDWSKIKEIYANCPDGYHVDHIIPLQGEDVSGLHVPWNLQYLTAKDNLSKSNKLCDIVSSESIET